MIRRVMPIGEELALLRTWLGGLAALARIDRRTRGFRWWGCAVGGRKGLGRVEVFRLCEEEDG
jgi:hypothetical protein